MSKRHINIDVSNKPPIAYFDGGTIVLNNLSKHDIVPDSFQWVNAEWRCPAVHYREIKAWLKQQGIRNRIPRWKALSLSLNDPREPHDYQTEALEAWHEAQRWGSIVLPTGAGKTFVALQAIAQTSVSTLIVVPTVDLLHQWYARLVNTFETDIGVWYGQEKELQPITVTTYPSAWANSEALVLKNNLLSTYPPC